MNYKILFSLFAIFLLSFASCDPSGIIDDDDSATSDSSISARINGESWEGDLAAGGALSEWFENRGVLLVIGYDTENLNTALASALSITIIAPDSVALFTSTYETVGSCDVTVESCARITYSTVDESLDFVTDDDSFPGAATIRLIENDRSEGGHVRGTFSGTLFNEDGERLEVTDGEFDIVNPE